MLVLSRKENETIIIGETVEITIVEICGQKVRLGIKAPRRIAVHRQEIFELLCQKRNEVDRLDPH